MHFAIAYFIVLLCLVPFLIGAGFGLDALLKYKGSSNDNPTKSLMFNGNINQKRPINRTTIDDSKDSSVIQSSIQVHFTLLPSATTLESINNAIFKFQTKLIKADQSCGTSVISPLASTIPLLFMIFAGGDNIKTRICTATGLNPNDFTLPLNMTSSTVVTIRSLIDTLKPNVKTDGHYRISIDSECNIRNEIISTMTDLGVEVKKISSIPYSPTVKFSTSINFNIEATQFAYSCTKGSGEAVHVVVTARRGELPNLDAEFFELLPSSKNSGMDNNKLIIIRPSNGSDKIQKVKRNFSQLDFNSFLYYTKSQVNISLPLSITKSIHPTRHIFPSNIITDEFFDKQGNLLGNYLNLCDNFSPKNIFSANYDQDLTFQIGKTGLSACSEGAVGDPEDVKIDNKFIMLLLNKKTIVSLTIIDN